ncbi:MAG TPA: DUF3500 domain-containing protein [Ohtaekwangia sp.]|nr:DUF3500 domain-containing protein [Ohtaekwangia sp.]
MKFGLLAFCFVSFSCIAQIEMRANRFLSLLEKSQREKAVYAFNDEERLNWAFVPQPRNGLPIKEMNAVQRAALMELLKISLSRQGFEKATNVIQLENVLREIERREPHDTYRDPENYYLTIFGKPDAAAPWGWRLEGHHVAFNFSSVDGHLSSSTPSFLGSNPAVIPSGEQRGKRVLELEMELGFALINAFNAAQLKVARFSETAPSDILSFNSKQAKSLEPAGIAFTAMDKIQREIFLQLLDAYVLNYELGFSQKLMARIKKAGLEKLSFAWAGSLKPGAAHYYRIQGPMLLIEYDNTQNNANHIHSVVRDLTNDFAGDILREHYDKEHRN